MNEPKNSANSEPPDADDDDDDAATKLSELPAHLMFDDPPAEAPFGIIEPAPEDVELVAPTAPPPPPRPASSPESVQIRALGPAALSGDDIDVHGDTRQFEVPADPANAADAARALQTPQAAPPPFGVFPPQAPQAYPPQQSYQPQQSAPGQYESASPFAATAYANPTNAPNTQQLQQLQGAPPQRSLAYAPTAPAPFPAGPPAPVALQAKFAPPYAAPAGGGPASGIVWAIGGILVGLVLLGIIAFVLFWLLRSNGP